MRSREHLRMKYPTEDACIEQMRVWLSSEQMITNQRTIQSYIGYLKVVLGEFRKAGLPTLSYEISNADCKWYYGRLRSTPISKDWMQEKFLALRYYCYSVGNYDAVPKRLKWPKRAVKNKPMLEDDQPLRLLHTPMTPYEKFIIMCELTIGLRRVEVIRMQTKDIMWDRQQILIHGKNETERWMQFHPGNDDVPSTESVLKEALGYRDTLITKAKSLNPSVDIPDNVLLYERGGRLHPFAEKGSGVDEIIRKVSERSGVMIRNHALRRTFARGLAESGVSIDIISQYMGHRDTSTTKSYISWAYKKDNSLLGNLDFKGKSNYDIGELTEILRRMEKEDRIDARQDVSKAMHRKIDQKVRSKEIDRKVAEEMMSTLDEMMKEEET